MGLTISIHLFGFWNFWFVMNASSLRHYPGFPLEIATLWDEPDTVMAEAGCLKTIY